jgi:hypothetical protein
VLKPVHPALTCLASHQSPYQEEEGEFLPEVFFGIASAAGDADPIRVATASSLEAGSRRLASGLPVARVD